MTPEYTTQQEQSGASNASDFQPPTQNPQTAPSDLHQQSAGLQQTPNAEQVLSQNTATILVPSATGTTSITAQTQRTEVQVPQSTSAGLALWLALAVAAAVTVVALAHWVRARNRRVSSTDPAQVVPSTEELAIRAKQVNESESTKAQKQKKNSSKARPKKKTRKNRKR